MESNSVFNHTLSSGVWLQTELDSTKSHCQLIMKKHNLWGEKYTQVMKERENLHSKTDKGISVSMMVIETEAVIGWFKLQLWMWLIHEN